MKVIKPFFLGTIGGLALALVLVLGLYFSPIRETVYFRVDPEIADVRAKLSQYRDWLAQADLYIMEKGSGTSDSLQTAQTLAWREYKKWRNHLGELARLHDRPTAEGFWSWTYSIRYFAIPLAIFMALLPGLGLAWRVRNRFRPRPAVPASTKYDAVSSKQNALTSLQATLKKIAEISDSERKAVPPTKPELKTQAPKIPPEKAEKAETEETEETEPETKPIPIFTDTGLATNFLQAGSVWSESVTSEAGLPASRLSMEDEDGAQDSGEGKGILHPTTELEKVERRKDQVLILARKGLTSSEISRRMRISQDQVEFIIRLRREKG